MNPSYDNNFDSLNPGGPAQSGNSSEPPTPQSIQQPTSQSTPQFVQQAPIQPTPQLPQQFPEQPLQPISSGQGDIILASPQSKKSKKWLIFVVVILLTIIAIVVVFLLLNRTKGTDGYESTATTTREKFNDYVNYVLFGKNSIEDIRLENGNLYNQPPYYSKIGKDELETYLKNAENKYNSLVNAYFEGEGELSFNAMSSLFQLYPQVVLIDEDAIISQYVSNGLEPTKEFINDYYAVSGSDNYLSYYIENARALSLLQLQLINEANLSGCMVDGQLKNNCYSPSDDVRKELFQYDFATDSAFQTLYSSAMNSIIDLYDELYDAKGVQDYDE